jgi:hypothetical protein
MHSVSLTFFMLAGASAPRRLTSRVLAMARNCSHSATESLAKPVSLRRSTAGCRRFLFSRGVSGAMIRMEAWALSALRLTISTGRVPPCSDPAMGWKFAG